MRASLNKGKGPHKDREPRTGWESNHSSVVTLRSRLSHKARTGAGRGCETTLLQGMEPSIDPIVMLPRGAIYVHGKIKPEMGTPDDKNERESVRRNKD